MRLRRKPEAEAFLNSHPEYVIPKDHQQAGQFHMLFEKKQPLRIEIGMGKGDFIIEMAKRNPEINFIGIEKYDSVLYAALKKLLLQPQRIPNLRIMQADAIDLKEIFCPQEVDRIYLNFSDPWPKKKHYKRRLTYRDFLSVYQHILIPNGYLELKTDNRILFEYSLVSMNQYPMHFESVCLDLHHSEFAEENIMTEYERKFSPNGPIYRLIAHF